jgi:hypothetical protein
MWRIAHGATAVTALISILVTLLVLTLLDRVSLTVPTAIVASALTLFAGLLTQTWLSDRQHQRDIQMKLREQKTNAYQGFVSLWMNMLLFQGTNDAGQITVNIAAKEPSSLRQDVIEASKPIMLWASNEVVKAYGEFKNSTSEALPSGQDEQFRRSIRTLLLFEQLIYRMREDVGHDTSGSVKYRLLSFFVNDIQEVRKRMGVE